MATIANQTLPDSVASSIRWAVQTLNERNRVVMENYVVRGSHNADLAAVRFADNAAKARQRIAQFCELAPGNGVDPIAVLAAIADEWLDTNRHLITLR